MICVTFNSWFKTAGRFYFDIEDTGVIRAQSLHANDVTIVWIYTRVRSFLLNEQAIHQRSIFAIARSALINARYQTIFLSSPILPLSPLFLFSSLSSPSFSPLLASILIRRRTHRSVPTRGDRFHRARRESGELARSEGWRVKHRRAFLRSRLSLPAVISPLISTPPLASATVTFIITTLANY